MRVEFDEFASASYRHGSDIFSARAYVGASSPSDLLDRASLLTVLAGEHGEVMDATQEAVEEKAVADTRGADRARATPCSNRDAASSAKVTAQQAYDTAVAAQDAAQAEVDAAGQPQGDARLPEQRRRSVTTAAGAVVLPAKGRLTSTYGARNGTHPLRHRHRQQHRHAHPVRHGRQGDRLRPGERVRPVGAGAARQRR